MNQYPDKLDQQLIAGLSKLNTEKELEAFLRDLLTISEIKEASKRLEIARLLEFTEMSYAEIAQELKTSTTTVTRVNSWLNQQGGPGYKTVLSRLFPRVSKPQE